MSKPFTRKRTALVLCVMIALFVVFDIVFWTSKIASARTPYNLILVSIDTLRPDHLGVYGYNKNTSPNIDAFAQHALTFTDAHNLVPATYPSFTSLMTGLSPYQTGIYNNGTTQVSKDGRRIVLQNRGNPHLSESEVTMAQVLQQAGYTTAGFVGNPVLSDEFTGMGKGFGTYTVFDEPQQGIEANAQATQHAVAFLQAQSQTQKPFFLWVHVLDPHSPYTPSVDVACKMDPSSCATIKQKGLQVLEQERKSLQECQANGLPQSTVKTFEALYDGEIAYSDRLVGKVFDQIKSLGLEKNSVIVFYGDHGEGFDHDYYFDHGGVLYDSATHIPLIISSPDYHGAEQKTAYPVTNAEILPTILRLLHLKTPLPSGVPQTNFASVFTDGKTREMSAKDTNGDVYSMNVYLTSFSLREKNYKYIYTIDGNCAPTQDQLFDLSADPKELHNIATEHRDMVETMRNKLLEYVISKGFMNGGKYKMIDQQQPSPNSASTEQNQQQMLQKIRELGY